MTTDLRLHDTATRRKVDFAPLDPTNVRLYLCGPTVYDRAHLGNARNVIVFDVLSRLLRHLYGEDHVTYVRNVTDVDDKINARAAAEVRPIAEVTEQTLRWYHDDMAALGNLPPDHEPRATLWVPQMIEMIQGLIDKGHAYEAEGHVLFSVASDPSYGCLSGRDTDDMIAGARIEVAPFKREPMDFVMWKPSDDATPGWDSPWGRGRPGWHIECSAMAYGLLGESFDIHGGGNDLMFPHHENELAQSRCAHPDGGFAQVWLHNEMLLVDGRKMSKSLGNFFTVRDLLDQGIPGAVIRLVMLGTHYGKPMDWTDRKRADAASTLDGWRKALMDHGVTPGLIADVKASGDWTGDAEFLGVLANDINTPGAIARLHVLARERTAERLMPLAFGLEILGIVSDWTAFLIQKMTSVAPDVAARIDALLVARKTARAAKDWAEADRIRDILTGAGVQVADTGGHATWEPGPEFDATRLEGGA